MAKLLYTEEYIQNIANAIRTVKKEDESVKYYVSQMADAILTLTSDVMLFNYDEDICSLFASDAGSWGDVAEFDHINHANAAMQLNKDFIVKINVKNSYSGEQEFMRIYAGSENFYHRIRVSNGNLQIKIQFGGGDVIQWTNINFNSDIEVRYLQGTGEEDRKLEIYDNGVKVAEYTPDSYNNRRPWNNTGSIIYKCAPQYLNSFISVLS